MKAKALKPLSTLDGLALNEIGERMALTRERVRQIEAKALIKLRKQLSLRNLRSINQFI